MEFVGEVIEWRGPAPFLFVQLPVETSAEIKAISARLTYGWGCIPVLVRLKDTEFRTSLMPKEGRYLVPLKVVVQRAENVQLGDQVKIILFFDPV